MEAWRSAHLRLAMDAAAVALWSWDPDTGAVAMDARAFDLWALPGAGEAPLDDLLQRVLPDDRTRVGEALATARTTPGPFEIDFRVMRGPEIRWLSARGRGAESADGRMIGIFLDVTERERAEAGRERLASEMSHRVKNVLAVATGLTRIASRSAGTASELASEIIGRLMALNRAHDLVLPIPGREAGAAQLGDLCTALLAPYEKDGARGRVRVAAAPLEVGEVSAQALALVLHELATNSVKHGALSAASGSLALSCHAVADDLKMVWTESGAPTLAAPPEMTGFGSRLLKRSLADQLGGAIAYDWRPDGLVITLNMSRARLAR